jgi:hypothetical protein
MDKDKNHPDMEEPSVLDYLKSKLKFWERGQKVDLFAQEQGLLQPAEGESPVTQPEMPVGIEKPPESNTSGRHWPWRSLLALIFALLGQRVFEPSPTRSVIPGLVLYGFGFAWLMLAYLRKEWTLTPYPETGTGSDNQKVRRLPLILGVVLSVAAFLTLGDNLFTLLNVTLWVLHGPGFLAAARKPTAVLAESEGPFNPR